jgi:fumarate hydratase subunit beta
MVKITTPVTQKQILTLKAGDQVSLTGVIYTARDQAHKRLCEFLAKGKKPPFDIKGQVIYYCGPTQTPKGKIIGSCGPTTSRRMDRFTVPLLKNGLSAMIGKGSRSFEVLRATKKYRGIYFITYAGCGALLSKYVCNAKVIAFPELGPEAIQRLEVKDFPLIVAIDCKGENIFPRIKNEKDTG